MRALASPALLTTSALLATGALLAGCGASDPSNSAASESAREQKAEAQLADFARCLREHGVNAETAGGPGGGHALKVSPGKAGSGPGPMEAAQKACARYRPQEKRVNLSPQQKVELEEELQKFAKCMREHGIKVETSTSGGSVRIGIHGGPGAGGPNPESPGFQAAQNACQKLLPKPPGGGKGGPGPVPRGASRGEFKSRASQSAAARG
jgi:hypothetical protein